MRGAPLLLPLAALALLLVAGSAAAHANLASATPRPNSNVAVGLEEVVVRWTEQVDPDATVVEVIHAESGEGRNAGAPTFIDDDYAVRVPVEPLQDGIHTVRWRALSTTDGHTTRGAFVFAVGSASLGPNAPPPVDYTEADYDTSAIVREGFPRAVFFGGLFLGIGMPLFGLVVLRGEPLGNRLVGTAGVFALLGGLGGLVTLLLLARALDFSLAQATSTVVGSLFLRRALLLLAAGALLLAALALAPERRRAPVLVALALGLAALVTTSLSSHAAGVTERRALALASDMLHLLMGAVWIGGVVSFLHVLWGRTSREAATMIARFSPMAIASVVALLATGTYAAVIHLPRWSDLWLDPYGRLVAAKVVLMLPLLALGAYNQRVLEPRLREERTETRYFRRAVQVEALVMAAVIGLAGALAASAPPRDDAGAFGGDGDAPLDEGPPAFTLDQTTRRSHVVLELRPDPPTVGPANLTITVHTAQLPESTQVYVVFRAPDAPPGDEGQLVVLDRVLEDTWTKEGTWFTTPGSWQLDVTIQRGRGFEAEKLTFEVPVGAGGAPAG